MYQPQNMAGIA